MKSRWIAAAMAAVSLALGLAACGGSDDSSSAAPSAPQTTAGSAGGKGGALTPPGTALALGEEATVVWVPLAEEAETDTPKGIELNVSVEAVEKKAIDDLSDLGLGPDEEEDTPYFVKLRMEALGNADTPKDEGPNIAFNAVDDRGQDQQPLGIIGNFPDCETGEPPQPFTDGASYESCGIYLIHSGGSIEEIQWTDGPAEEDELTPYFEDPVVWKAG
jgi:hypothetical protein